MSAESLTRAGWRRRSATPDPAGFPVLGRRQTDAQDTCGVSFLELREGKGGVEEGISRIGSLNLC